MASGKGFIGTHSASDTFHTHNNAPGTPERYRNFGEEADPYAKMLGGQFIVHGAQQMATMRVVDPTFPGFSKCGKSFDLKEEWYSLKDFQPDLHVLLVQEAESMKGGPYERPAYPATWARKHGQGRVFYTSMGHREEVWSDTIFQDILVGGVSWAVGNVKADVTPNLSEVAPKAAENPQAPPPKAPATPKPTLAPPKG